MTQDPVRLRELLARLLGVCSLEHLIEMKRASERARDHEDLAALEAVQEEDRRGK